MMVLGVTRCEPVSGVMAGDAGTVSSRLENNKGLVRTGTLTSGSSKA
jgi:hypothetical protein